MEKTSPKFGNRNLTLNSEIPSAFFGSNFRRFRSPDRIPMSWTHKSLFSVRSSGVMNIWLYIKEYAETVSYNHQSRYICTYLLVLLLRSAMLLCVLIFGELTSATAQHLFHGPLLLFVGQERVLRASAWNTSSRGFPSTSKFQIKSWRIDASLPMYTPALSMETTCSNSDLLTELVATAFQILFDALSLIVPHHCVHAVSVIQSQPCEPFMFWLLQHQSRQKNLLLLMSSKRACDQHCGLQRLGRLAYWWCSPACRVRNWKQSGSGVQFLFTRDKKIWGGGQAAKSLQLRPLAR
jgi:hypothetical protein